MSFTAKFRGWCRACEDTIEIGEACMFDAQNDTVHVACPPPVREPAKAICGGCFLELPTSGICGVCDE